MKVYVLNTDYNNITYSPKPADDIIDNFIEVEVDESKLYSFVTPKYDPETNSIVEGLVVDSDSYKKYAIKQLNELISSIRGEGILSQDEVYSLKLTEKYPLEKEANLRGITKEELVSLISRQANIRNQLLIDTELDRIEYKVKIMKAQSIIEVELLVDEFNNKFATKYS